MAEITERDIEALFAETARKHSIEEIYTNAQQLADMGAQADKTGSYIWLERNDMEVLLAQEDIRVWQSTRQSADSYIIQVFFRELNFFHAGHLPWWKEQFPLRP